MLIWTFLQQNETRILKTPHFMQKWPRSQITKCIHCLPSVQCVLTWHLYYWAGDTAATRFHLPSRCINHLQYQLLNPITFIKCLFHVNNFKSEFYRFVNCTMGKELNQSVLKDNKPNMVMLWTFPAFFRHFMYFLKK